MKKRLLITGVTGFLGGALKEYFSRREKTFEVFGLSRRRQAGEGLFCADPADASQMVRLLRRLQPEYIFPFSGGDRRNPESLFLSQYLVTQCLLEAILKAGLLGARVVIPGSAAEYGRPTASRRLLTEEDQLRPEGWYGFMKFMQTSLGLFYARHFGLNVMVGRIFNVTGTNAPARLAPGKFASDIALIEVGRKVPVIETHDLSGRRDFTDVNDVCAALWVIARRGRRGEVYNICSGRPVSIRGLLQQMLKHSKRRDCEIREHKDETSGTFNVIGANAKIRQQLKWSPRVSLSASLRQTLESHRRRIKEDVS